MGRSLIFLERGSVDRNRMTIFLVICLLFPLAIHASSIEEIPIDHWVYSLIDNLQKRGHFGELYVANRPYTRLEVARYVLDLLENGGDEQLDRAEEIWVERLRGEFEWEISLLKDDGGEGGNEFSYGVRVRGESRGDIKEDSKELEPPYESIKFGGAVDPDFAVRGEIGGILQYKNMFVFVDRFQADSDPINEPAFRLRGEGVRWRNYNLPGAYFSGRFGPISLLFGRSNLIWGNGANEALTISGISPPFDLFQYSMNVSTLRATAFLAFLDTMMSNGSRINRYLYGHRIDWRTNPWLQLGFSEVAVVTGEGRGIDFSYLNPLLPYLFIQEEERNQVDADAYSSLNGSVYLSSGLFFSGELLIDDTFFFRTDYNRDFPFQVAFSLEADWSGYPLPTGTMLSMAYTRIGSFVYLHRGEATYYSHYNAPIGHPLGPDTDMWRLGLSYPMSEDLELEIGYQARRRGENRLEPAVSARGHRGEPFPSGVVERRKGLELGLEWFVVRNILFRSDFFYTRVRNLNNQRGLHDSISNLELSLSYFHNIDGFFSGI